MAREIDKSVVIVLKPFLSAYFPTCLNCNVRTLVQARRIAVRLPMRAQSLQVLHHFAAVSITSCQFGLFVSTTVDISVDSSSPLKMVPRYLNQTSMPPDTGLSPFELLDAPVVAVAAPAP